jgi:uncharacterized protein
MSFRHRVAAGALLGLLALAAPAAAVQPAIPATPPDYVVDLAGVMDAGARSRTSALLRQLEERTGAQIVVLTLQSLDGEALEAFSIDVAHNRWKLGQKGKDNGVLVTLAVADRKYRIEVGYGLESVLPDSLVGSLGREVLVPAFRAGDFGGGLAALAGELAGRVAAASGVALSGAPAPGMTDAPRRGPPPARPAGPLQLVFLALAAIVFLWLLIRHPQLLILMLLSSRGGGRGSWGGGGGGFGGGGGGGFGGGGSSGSW